MSAGLAPNATSPSWGRRLAGVEGLRGAAALMVLTTHVGAGMAPTATSTGGLLSEVGALRHGLTLFFVLSGFLLFRPYASSLLAGKPLPSFKRYLSNRLLRIFPAYLVVLLLVSYVVQTARLSASGPVSRYEASGALPLGDLLISIPLLQTLNPGTIRVGLSVAWSLTTEFTFYLVLPLLAVLALRISRRVPPLAAALVSVAILAVIGWAGKLVMVMATRGMSTEESLLFRWGHEWSAVFARSILVHADLFAVGMAAAVLVVLYERGTIRLDKSNLVRGFGFAAFIVAAVLALKGYPTRYFEDSVAAVAAALVILVVVLPNRKGLPNITSKVLDWAPLRYAGLSSYGVYLWHMHVMWWLQKNDLAFSDSPLGFWANMLIVAAITYVLAALTYRFVEKPALARKKSADRTAGGQRAAVSEPAAR